MTLKTIFSVRGKIQTAPSRHYLASKVELLNVEVKRLQAEHATTTAAALNQAEKSSSQVRDLTEAAANASAIQKWQTLLAKSRSDAPWIANVRDNIKSAAKAGNITLDPSDTVQPTGPDAKALADAAKMTEDEQNEMIAGMVKRLRDRLVEEPHDVSGWLRLARAYNVLGQAENALDALANGAKSAPGNLDLQLGMLEQILAMGTTKVQLERARLVLATGEKIDPKNPQILFFKGHLAQLSGETERARTAWQKLQDILDPESEAAKALEAEIEKLPKPKN